MRFDETKYNRFDVVFSNWIFLFFLLYWCGLVKYNPLLLLCIGLVHNILLFVLYVFYNQYRMAIALGIVNLFIKILPIYTIRHIVILKKDVIFSLILMFIYIVYLCGLFYIVRDNEAFAMFDTEKIHPGFFDYYVLQWFIPK